MNKLKELIKKFGIWGAIAIIAAYFVVAVITTSCNVTRTVTTTSSVFTKGDTTTTIVSKTIESYDATKK